MANEKRKMRLAVLLGIAAAVLLTGFFGYTVGVPLARIALQKAREAARREQVRNNLEQLKQAIDIYNQTNPSEQAGAARTDAE